MGWHALARWHMVAICNRLPEGWQHEGGERAALHSETFSGAGEMCNRVFLFGDCFWLLFSCDLDVFSRIYICQKCRDSVHCC